LSVHRVFASIDPGNTASIELFELLGMRQEGHFRESLWFKGEWADDVIFAMLQADWEHKKSERLLQP
jgi:RimJ/RimL family protein N-acetyltransferase